MQTGEIIMEALGVLRTKGWCKLALTDQEGRHCAVGAINALESANGGEKQAAWRGLAYNIPNPQECMPLDVPGYNNSRQDFSEIEEWFEKAAANEGYIP